MPTLLHVPPWGFDYSYQQVNSVVRTALDRGFKKQAKRSHRQITLATVVRKLTNIELPYFEWFIRSVCVDGSIKFTDTYRDGNGVQSGEIRIVDGKYTVTTNGHNHSVKCQIEIFR